MAKYLTSIALLAFATACGKSPSPRDTPLPPQAQPPAPTPSTRLDGRWLTQDVTCGAASDRSGQEHAISFDSQGFVFRYLVDELDDQHRCLTIRMYQRAQIVTDPKSTEPRNSSGTYDLYLRAVRHVCQHIHDGKLDDELYKDVTDATIPQEYFQVKLQFLDADSLELTSDQFPNCSQSSFRAAYRRG